MSTLSMTGFGKAQFSAQGKSINIEIKCLNSKQQDLSIRLASKYKSLELSLRTLVLEQLTRGKIEVNIYAEQSAESKCQQVNEEVFKAYAEQLKLLTGKELDSELISAILKLPDVFSAEREEIDESEANLLMQTLEKALQQVMEFRLHEGATLEQELKLRIKNIADRLVSAQEIDEERTQKIKSRLNQAVSEIAEALLDKNRFEQELIYYLEKIDITEEKVRLKSHLDYFSETLKAPGEKGKKLAFISQEMGREINTMGSKANDSSLQKVVVEMKDELEKIKEQLLNIL